MASVARGMFGGALPWGMVAIGAAIGVAIIVIDEILRARGSSFRAPVLAVAVGIYLPLELMVPIFLGGLLNHLVTRNIGPGLSGEDLEKRGRTGMLFAAGLITGEALMGILIAIPIVVWERADILALPDALHLPGAWGEFGGLVLLAAIALWLYRIGTRKPA
jgi:putative OPT family oligopeptide transporter